VADAAGEASRSQALAGTAAANSTASLLNISEETGSIVNVNSDNTPLTVTGTGMGVNATTYAVGTKSMNFSAVGNHVATPSNARNWFGTADFTLETWVRPTTGSAQTIFSNYPASSWNATNWTLNLGHPSLGAGRLAFWARDYNASGAMLVAPAALTPNVWTHVAVTRQGSTWRLFVNGSVVATAASAVALDGSTSGSRVIAVGLSENSSLGFVGQMDGVKVTRGVAQYTAGFTPTGSPLEPGIVQNSAWGGARTYANGTFASSCQGYRQAAHGQPYAGATGDGLYVITPSSSQWTGGTAVYCDMTTDGGGWTFVLARKSNETAVSGWNEVGSYTSGSGSYTAPLTTSAEAGSSSKWSDAFINALAQAGTDLRSGQAAFRIDYTYAGVARRRYFAATSYGHRTAAAGAALTSYATANLTGAKTGTGGGACGFSDYSYAGANYAYVATNNGCSGSFGVGNGAANGWQGTTGDIMNMWVR